MSRKELLDLIREIAKVIFFDGHDMSSEEKVIRIKAMLIDSLTEAESVPTFEREIKNK